MKKEEKIKCLAVAQDRFGDGHHSRQDDGGRGPTEMESGLDDAKRDMENALGSKTRGCARTGRTAVVCFAEDVRRGKSGTACKRKAASLAGRGREMILQIQPD